MEINRLTRDGTAEPVSRDQILRRERGQGNISHRDDHTVWCRYVCMVIIYSRVQTRRTLRSYSL